jgi:hypothetical protein
VNGFGGSAEGALDPGWEQALSPIMDENTAGDPMSLLRWTNKSTTRIAEELNGKGTRRATRRCGGDCASWATRFRPMSKPKRKGRDPGGMSSFATSTGR